MGSTRRRVTFLVLALESIGFVMLAFALWLAGDTHLECRARGPQLLSCTLEERRLLFLWQLRAETWQEVTAVLEGGAEDSANRSILLRTATGDIRSLQGSPDTIRQQVAKLEALRLQGGEAVELRHNDVIWSLLALALGLLWLLVISLIMREFLGFHTPWWWRIFAPRQP